MAMSDATADREAIIALIHRNRIAIWTNDFELWDSCFVHADYMSRWGWWQAGGMFARRGWDDIARRLRSNPPPAIDAYAYDTKLLNLSLQIGDGMAWATFDQLYPEGASRYGGGTGLVREARVTCPRYRTGRAFGVNAGGEQRLGRVDVADPDDDMLIHQEGFHRRAAPARGAPQIIAVEIRTERLRPQLRE